MRAIVKIAFITLLLVTTSTAIAQVNIGAGVWSMSPDGRVVEVNGGISSTSGSVVGWIYDWGDGTKTTGYFPTVHRFPGPGTYSVTLTGYDDRGYVGTSGFDHIVPTFAGTPVRRVALSTYELGLKSGEQATVQIAAYDEEGVPLPPSSLLIETHNLAPSCGGAAVEGTSLVVTTAQLLDRDTCWLPLLVYVDKVEAEAPLNVIVNGNSGSFHSAWGQHTGTYLPMGFFTASVLSDAEFSRILDLALEYDRWSVRDKGPDSGDRPVFQGVSYSPPAYGGSGNPLVIGDFTLPVGGVPQFAVMFHEMGHNFHGANIFFNGLGVPGAFYQETAAEWYVQHNLNGILLDHSPELSSPAVDGLERIRTEGRAYHEFEYQNYIDGGMVFDYNHISSSHVLVKKIYDYSDVHGWNRIRDFMDLFDLRFIPSYAALLATHGGLTTDNKVTYFIAALSETFGTDLLPEFESLNFPVNRPLYEALARVFRRHGEVQISFQDSTVLMWRGKERFSRWNLYRGDLYALRTTGVYTQDPLTVAEARHLCDLSDSVEQDLDVPTPGGAFFYLITGLASGVEGSLGINSENAERPNTNPCP